MNARLLNFLLLIIVAHGIVATFWPTGYGFYLQKMDNARYQYTINE